MLNFIWQKIILFLIIYIEKCMLFCFCDPEKEQVIARYLQMQLALNALIERIKSFLI